MRTMTTTILALLCSLVLARPIRAQTPPCPAGTTPILILGTYHMSNPGQDAVNLEADDVLSARRQREIADVVEKLARFHPTKVAVEASRTSPLLAHYAEYRAGTYTLSRNEIEQIGFRLAAKLGHEKVWGVDYPMWMSGITPAEMHEPKPKPASAETKAADDSPRMREIRAVVADDDQRLRAGTVASFLGYLNTPERYARNQQWDVIANLEPGSGVALYENTDEATNWYKRNLRIATNILEITAPDDRILLLIGAGHQPILKALFAEHPRYCLVPTSAYLP